MKKFKPLIVLASLLIALTLIIPAVLVLPFSGEHQASGKLGEDLTKKGGSQTKEANATPQATDPAVEVAVFRSAKSKIETVQLENYLVGVVAAEMNADFKEEALKAQALAARTYIVNRLVNKDTIGVPKGAQVTDTQNNQVYKNDDELRKQWGADYEWKRKKILDAVRATGGQILTYDGKPIDALFFSTSNGYTENSEDYWPSKFPYLRSVSSPWDKQSPKFTSQKVLPVKEFESLLGVKIGAGSTIGKIVERTTGKRVGKVDFNGKVLTGKDVRDKLDLRSSDFAWERKGDNIVITTKGFGHGVGMSQYGANGMAEEGADYQEIVKHYYQGVEISPADPMLATVTAQK
ncbi:stage II sporulation protein D [Neobacillus sp. OS1-2]|uniref:stage II sporulation protein D n=1 Tax=Neobacillus sp. OS1-2 TaxID=3070680 RepID=UPI0027DFA55F|nr:stage II sporulation protein D [Neobacillus sp. OS1-2]WML41590.1 stage II sporulation protein D [Neobacillus sp. OS1-2]